MKATLLSMATNTLCPSALRCGLCHVLRLTDVGTASSIMRYAREMSSLSWLWSAEAR